MFERPGRVADRFPPPFANDQAARVVNGGAVPPDFSVIAKARTFERGFPWFILDAVIQYQEHGVDYIVALLHGYEEPPADLKIQSGLSYNKYFPGQAIAMPKPLSDDQVTYTDGAPETVDQYAKDFGPFVMARAVLEPQGRWAEFRESFEDLVRRFNAAADGTVRIPADYLLITVDRSAAR